MYSKKYDTEVVSVSAPRSGSHFLIDLLKHYDIKSYTSIHHHPGLIKINSKNFKTITSIRNPLESLTSFVILGFGDLDNFKDYPYSFFYDTTKRRIENLDYVEQWVSFIEVAEETKATTILFDNLISNPIQTVIDLNKRLNLELTVSESDISIQDQIVEKIKNKPGNHSLYNGYYPRGLKEASFYKPIEMAIKESPKCHDAYAIYESYKSRYKF